MSVQLTVALQSDKTIGQYRAQAALVEALGFDGLSVYADLGFQPPLAALLTAASVTRRLRLGPSALNPYLQHPVDLAGQHAVLDEASGGRAYLGLVRGSWLERVGVVQTRALRTLEESIDVVRMLIAGDRSGYHGEVFRIDPGVGLHWEPVRREVDVLLGTWGPRGAELAGRVAQEVKIGGSANPLMVALMRGWLDASSRAAGRGTGAVRLAAGAVTVVDRDRGLARARARTEVARYLGVVATLDPTVSVDPAMLLRLRELLAAGRPDEAGALLPADTLSRFCLAGTPHDVVEQAAALIEAGADRIEFGTPHGLDERSGLELLGTQVLPALRELSSASTSSDRELV